MAEARTAKSEVVKSVAEWQREYDAAGVECTNYAREIPQIKQRIAAEIYKAAGDPLKKLEDLKAVKRLKFLGLESARKAEEPARIKAAAAKLKANEEAEVKHRAAKVAALLAEQQNTMNRRLASAVQPRPVA